MDVAILGATGTVGQKLITLLQGHPFFTIKELVASDRSAGRSYEQACSWKQNIPIPRDVASMKIASLSDSLHSKILFSGLDSSVAFEAEKKYAELGHVIISNAKNHRMESHVPLVIPEINHTHLHAINKQSYKGAIITNPNCATIAMALALAPLHREFTIEKIMVHTMQAVSGAGYPGVSSIDILGNVIPYISDEEEKLQTEVLKIFGEYQADTDFNFANIAISAHCNRVPVFDGHTENISLSFKNTPSEEQILAAWKGFKGYPQEQNLPTAPKKVIWYMNQDNRPQPSLDLLHDNGMASSIGRLRKCAILDYKMTVLGHNTIRGAAGSTILNAETAHAMNLLS